ncbi:MAG TPA: hypothetical protein VGI27_04150, partial [Solirubrobacteraceae bacterium]
VQPAFAPLRYVRSEEASLTHLTGSLVKGEFDGMSFALFDAHGDTPDFSLPSEEGAKTLIGSAALVVAAVQRQTDAIFRPTPLGVSVYFQFRSAAAPERLQLGSNIECAPSGFELIKRIGAGTFVVEGRSDFGAEECEPYSHERIPPRGDAAPVDMRARTRSDRPSWSGHWTVMVTSRRAGGSFAAATVLTSHSYDVAPAVAVQDGEATVLWAGTDGNQVVASTFAAGTQPSAPVVLDEPEPGPRVTDRQFGSLGLNTGTSGAQLATWRQAPYSGSPVPVSLRAAWRGLGTPFSAAQTVSGPGVEVRGYTVALDRQGRALIAWRELTATGEGPMLSYATALPGARFAQSPAVAGSPGEEQPLGAAWLADGSAFVTWRANGTLLAAAWTAGGPFGAAERVAMLGEEQAVTAAGGAAPPVIVWIGRSPFDASASAVRYIVANGFGGVVHRPLATVVLPAHQDLTKSRKLVLRIHCVHNCTLSVDAGVYTLKGETAEEAAAAAFREIGTLRSARRTLAAERSTVLRLGAPRSLLRKLCRTIRRNDEAGVEARVAVHDLGTGQSQSFVLGSGTGGRGCRR